MSEVPHQPAQAVAQDAARGGDHASEVRLHLLEGGLQRASVLIKGGERGFLLGHALGKGVRLLAPRRD